MAEQRWAITVKAVAERYEVEADTVYAWIRAGKLSALKLPGGDLRITPDDLAEFNRTCRGQSSQPPDTGSEGEGDTGPSAGPTPKVVALSPHQRARLKRLRQKSGATST